MQGGTLSPLLFNMYIADIEKILADGPAEGIEFGKTVIHLLLFAHDTVVLARSAQGLKLKIRILQNYLLCARRDIHYSAVVYESSPKF